MMNGNRKNKTQHHLSTQALALPYHKAMPFVVTCKALLNPTEEEKEKQKGKAETEND